MPLTEGDLKHIEQFRDHVAQAMGRDERFGPAVRSAREDMSSFLMRFPIAPSCWVEATVRPYIPQVRVGFVTDDRWKSEEAEDAIEDSGDTMPEFVEMGFEDAGLTWEEPPVEHYRNPEKFFYFATPFELKSLAELDLPETRDRTLRMLKGYCNAFAEVALKGADEANG